MPIGISKLNSLGQNKEFFLAVAHVSSPRVTAYSQDSSTFTKLNNPTDLPGGDGWAVSWSPDGVYLAVGHEITPFLTIYKRSGTTLTKLSDPANLPPAVVYGCSFSNDGVYLATVADTGTSNFRVYKRDGDTFTSIHTTTLGASGRACSWDQSGTYLLITHRGSTDKIAVYKRDGDTFTKLTNPPSYPATQANWGSFSNDGVYLAVGSDGTPYINIWKRSGDTFTKLASPSINSAVCRSARFDPSGTYMAIHSSTSPYVGFYKRVNDTFWNIPNPATLPTGDPIGIGSWTADGRYYAMGHVTSPRITIYERFGDTFTKLANPGTLPASTGRTTEFYPRGLDVTSAINERPFTQLAVNGNAVISTTQYKFGSSSAYFDGTGDSVRFVGKTLEIGTNDFTFEFWVYATSLAANRHVLDCRTTTSSQIAPLIYVSTAGALIYYVNGASRITSSNSAIVIDTWYHVAVSRSSTTTRMFIDGTQVGSDYTDSNTYVSTPITLGGYYPTNANSHLGYIDEFRMSKTARYTSNFTAPTAAFTNDGNTLLLLHFEGANNSTSFTDDAS